MSEDQLPQFSNIKDRVFSEKGKDLYLGKEKVSPEMRTVLKDQARYFYTTQLYEIIKSSIQNEAMEMALTQSTEWEHVLAAKMLWHWQYFLDNMLLKLTKD